MTEPWSTKLWRNLGILSYYWTLVQLSNSVVYPYSAASCILVHKTPEQTLGWYLINVLNGLWFDHNQGKSDFIWVICPVGLGTQMGWFRLIAFCGFNCHVTYFSKASRHVEESQKGLTTTHVYTVRSLCLLARHLIFPITITVIGPVVALWGIWALDRLLRGKKGLTTSYCYNVYM